MQLRLSIVAAQVLISLQAGAVDQVEIADYMSVMQAHQYQEGLNVNEYWKSEKLDGIRAIWDGKQLYTRNGREIFAPSWFTESLPHVALEGELWAGRGNFHLVQQTVLDHQPVNESWRKIDFMLFDMPHAAGDYQKRYYNIIHLVSSLDQDHIKYIEHTPIQSEKELFEHLDNVNSKQGEGLMLRKVTSRYQAGRSSDMLKLKSHQDDEAKVIGYKVGKGQYKGMMGAMLVQWSNGIEFYIGSGFTKDQRMNPPPIGSTITFRYNGLTQNGVPKFARYLRERVE